MSRQFLYSLNPFSQYSQTLSPSSTKLSFNSSPLHNSSSDTHSDSTVLLPPSPSSSVLKSNNDNQLTESIHSHDVNISNHHTTPVFTSQTNNSNSYGPSSSSDDTSIKSFASCVSSIRNKHCTIAALAQLTAPSSTLLPVTKQTTQLTVLDISLPDHPTKQSSVLDSAPSVVQLTVLPAVKYLSNHPSKLHSDATKINDTTQLTVQLPVPSTKLVNKSCLISVPPKLPESVNLNLSPIGRNNICSSQSSLSHSESCCSDHTSQAQRDKIRDSIDLHDVEAIDDEDLEIRSTMNPKMSETESLAEATNRVFKAHQCYKNHYHFKKHINYFSACWGFTVVNSNGYKCSRGGLTQKKKNRPNKGLRKRTHNKIGCRWQINVKPLCTSARRSMSEDQLTDLGKNAITISSVCAHHTNGCCPGRNQYIICKKKAGGYAKELNIILHQIINHMTLKDNGYADPSYIRSLMKKVLPAGEAIYPQEVFNLRVRAKMLMKQLRSKKQMLNHIEFKPSDKEELFKPLDQVTDDLFDDAVECAKEVYLCYMNDDKNNFNLFAYLDKLASVDRGFTYNIATDNDGKMTGFCWMTSTMRSNFERFHGCIFLDAMRRKTNFHLWPYISIIIVNELGESQPVIEGFFYI